jgi:hypothetical protein
VFSDVLSVTITRNQALRKAVATRGKAGWRGKLAATETFQHFETFKRFDIPSSAVFSWNTCDAGSLTKQQAIEMLESDDQIGIGMDSRRPPTALTSACIVCDTVQAGRQIGLRHGAVRDDNAKRKQIPHRQNAAGSE